MQRTVVILAVILLVVASLAVGALAANWPFWHRAWVWHAAQGGWPAELPGPHAVVRGRASPLQFDAAGTDLAAAAGSARTQLLLRIRTTGADAWLAPGFTAQTSVDGRGLAVLVLAPLFVQLEQRHPGLLDQPVGAWIEAWRQDSRGALTPRALLAQTGNGIASRPVFTPLNPFSAGAQLVAGPDFQRAALASFGPAGTQPEAIPDAAAQVLSQIAATIEGRPFAAVLEQDLWSGLAHGDATLMLDRRRGVPAAHCCLRTGAANWLRLGMRFATAVPAASHAEARVLATSGRTLVVAPTGSTAVFWMGEGEPPSGLENLLREPAGG